jgi:protein involved in ribonucleotide reduction
MSERVTLSASRIKTAQSCSWLYWAKYKLKLPDRGNDGSSRGTVCHEVFEFLGDEKNKKDFNKIIEKQDIFASKKVKDLVLNLAAKEGVDDEPNMKQIKTMTLNGLNYDFFGQEFGKLTESSSEKDFEFDVKDGDLDYKIKGFIDKLFIYGDKAIIRDFKSSKEVYKGKDLEDNMQDLMYTLAVKKMFPQIKELYSEFLFIKFDLNGKGCIKMPSLTEVELTGFEQYLTHVQKYLDNFSEKTAKSNMAAKADYPKDNSFGGPIMCGRSKKGELKKDGTPTWCCSAKFDLQYYHIKDENDKIIDSCFIEDLDEYIEKYKDKKVEFDIYEYQGCPAFKNK